MHRKNTMEQSSGTAFEYARKEIVILKLPHTFKGVSCHIYQMKAY